MQRLLTHKSLLEILQQIPSLRPHTKRVLPAAVAMAAAWRSNAKQAGSQGLAVVATCAVSAARRSARGERWTQAAQLRGPFRPVTQQYYCVTGRGSSLGGRRADAGAPAQPNRADPSDMKRLHA
jgi:hypothetical protein